MFDSGKLAFASASSITLGPEMTKRFNAGLEGYKQRMVLRPQEISNHPEVIRRLGIIGINTALECDIYGNVNSTHVDGTHMMNGIGGSGDFARNAYMSVFVARSTAKGGGISTIVPMVTHVDHTEHDVDILVTENGLADLRGRPRASGHGRSSPAAPTRITAMPCRITRTARPASAAAIRRTCWRKPSPGICGASAPAA
ncbi:acetyl-CoA hydrolase/transferase C-terminal domain-containing protein [Teichococcus aestuarii]